MFIVKNKLNSVSFWDYLPRPEFNNKWNPSEIRDEKLLYALIKQRNSEKKYATVFALYLSLVSIWQTRPKHNLYLYAWERNLWDRRIRGNNCWCRCISSKSYVCEDEGARHDGCQSDRNTVDTILCFVSPVFRPRGSELGERWVQHVSREDIHPWIHNSATGGY